MARTNCMERAGQILIMSIWLEKRLADLIIFKHHPKIVEKFNNSNSSTRIPYTLGRERIMYWKKDFLDILDIFLLEFNPDATWRDSLKFVYNSRNVISHSYVSLNRDYLLYKPSSRSKSSALKKYHRLKKEFKLEKEADSTKSFMLTVNLSDDAIYNKYLRIFEEIDTVYLKYTAESLGLIYNKLR